MSDHPALSIGAVAGGPGTDQAWSNAVMALARRVIEVRGTVSSPLAVNVVFQIPGRFLTPDFNGVRSGGFSRKERELLVQVALPSESSATPDADVKNYLHQAIAVAEDFAQMEAMVDGPLKELRALMERL